VAPLARLNDRTRQQAAQSPGSPELLFDEFSALLYSKPLLE
jgi:hypothetical protein